MVSLNNLQNKVKHAYFFAITTALPSEVMLAVSGCTMSSIF
jgi:hypothetical protein